MTPSDPGTRLRRQEAHQSSALRMCPSCRTVNSRKGHIICNYCDSHWHRSCVGLTKAQAGALTRWRCPKCTHSALVGTEEENVSPPEQTTQAAHSTDHELAATLAKLKQTRHLLRRIPKGARIPAAEALATLIESATEECTVETWTRLLTFPLTAFDVPKKESGVSDSTSLTTKIKRQISARYK